MKNLTDRFAAAREMARDAGSLALDFFRNRDELTVKSKGVQDVVSVADRAVEDLIRDRLADAFPEDAILGEGGGGTLDIDAGKVIWVIDPIDGAQPFLAGVPSWCERGAAGQTMYWPMMDCDAVRWSPPSPRNRRRR